MQANDKTKLYKDEIIELLLSLKCNAPTSANFGIVYSLKI